MLFWAILNVAKWSRDPASVHLTETRPLGSFLFLLQPDALRLSWFLEIGGLSRDIAVMPRQFSTQILVFALILKRKGIGLFQNRFSNCFYLLMPIF